MRRCSKKSRRIAVGTTALPTPPAPMTRMRIDRSVAAARAAYDAARDRRAAPRTERAERFDRAGHPLAAGATQRLRCLADRGPAGDVRRVRAGFGDGAARRGPRGRWSDLLGGRR